MTNDARLRLAEILSKITGRKFEAKNACNIEMYDGKGHFFTLTDEEAMERLVKETGELSKLLARACKFILLICQDESQKLGGG